jgi:hypothetical protein
MSKISLTVCHHYTVTWTVISSLKVTTHDFLHTIGTKISIPEISVKKQGLFFRKVGYSMYDVPTEMLQTEYS